MPSATGTDGGTAVCSARLAGGATAARSNHDMAWAQRRQRNAPPERPTPGGSDCGQIRTQCCNVTYLLGQSILPRSGVARSPLGARNNAQGGQRPTAAGSPSRSPTRSMSTSPVPSDGAPPRRQPPPIRPQALFQPAQTPQKCLNLHRDRKRCRGGGARLLARQRGCGGTITRLHRRHSIARRRSPTPSPRQTCVDCETLIERHSL